MPLVSCYEHTFLRNTVLLQSKKFQRLKSVLQQLQESNFGEQNVI